MPKRLNVQEQNAQTKASLKKTCLWFQESADEQTTLIRHVLNASGIDANSGILLQYTPLDSVRICWLTADRKFITIEYDYRKPWWKKMLGVKSSVNDIVVLDVDKQPDPQISSANMKGTGKSSAWLSLELLDELLPKSP